MEREPPVHHKPTPSPPLLSRRHQPSCNYSRERDKEIWAIIKRGQHYADCWKILSRLTAMRVEQKVVKEWGRMVGEGEGGERATGRAIEDLVLFDVGEEREGKEWVFENLIPFLNEVVIIQPIF